MNKTGQHFARRWVQLVCQLRGFHLLTSGAFIQMSYERLL